MFRVGFILLCLAVIPWFLWKEYPVLKAKKRSIFPSIEVEEVENRFVVVVPCITQAPDEKIKHSCVAQSYGNYRIVYIGLKRFLDEEANSVEKVPILRSEDFVLAYLDYITNFCEPEDIIVHVGENSYLSDVDAVANLNHFYQNKEAFFTYSWPAAVSNVEREKAMRTFNKESWVAAPLKTYCAEALHFVAKSQKPIHDMEELFLSLLSYGKPSIYFVPSICCFLR